MRILSVAWNGVCTLFFFCSQPATSGISTLSLHDALPISGSSLDGRVQVWSVNEDGYSKVRWRVAGGPTRERDIKDRKSTRLNSSHRTISYAVFCLKKKRRCGRAVAGNARADANTRQTAPA